MLLVGNRSSSDMRLSVIHSRNATAYDAEGLAGTSGGTPSPEGRLGQVGSYLISTPTNRCHSSRVKLRQTFSHTISRSVSVRAIQTRMGPSPLMEARRVPSGLNATAQTTPVSYTHLTLPTIYSV